MLRMNAKPVGLCTCSKRQRAAAKKDTQRGLKNLKNKILKSSKIFPLSHTFPFDHLSCLRVFDFAACPRFSSPATLSPTHSEQPNCPSVTAITERGNVARTKAVCITASHLSSLPCVVCL